MLRKIRIALASLFFVGITLLFIGIGQQWWGWMAKIQFLPSLLALNFAVLAALIVGTLLFGRLYCSVICPLGVFQDLVIWLRGRFKGGKNRFHFIKEKKWIRYSILVVYIALLIAGVQALIALLAPYSAYGRMISCLVTPQGWPVILVAVLTFVALTILAWLGGRTYCNTICPVGTILSFFSRFAMFRPTIDASSCVSCGLCEKKCKASCIDVSTKTIDYSRCVDCFQCMDSCAKRGLKYRFSWGKKQASAQNAEAKVDGGKRAFLSSAIVLGTALTAKAQDEIVKLDGGFADVVDKVRPQSRGTLVPPGAKSEKNFYDHCTACQLCVAACPNNVLTPSTNLQHFMQPEMTYENGYCRPECSKCSEVCPSGAILPITPEEKTAIHIGHAVIDFKLCLADSQDIKCGNCQRHCPTGAIIMVNKIPGDRRSTLIPTVDESKCIGCGACENLCPSRPLSAIHVIASSTHIED